MQQPLYEPEHLERWYERVNFEPAEGVCFDDYYIASWRLFRCSPVDRSNFNYIKHQVDGCYAKFKDALANGWIVHAKFTDEVYQMRYYYLIHESQTRALKMADMLAARIKLKGSLDPENEKAIDVNSIRITWKNSTLIAKIRLCSEAGVSIFAARGTAFPSGVKGERIFNMLRESEAEHV
jgi:hypothetical protein